MTDAEYNALLEHANNLWKSALEARAIVRSFDAAWETVRAQLDEENLRRATAQRLRDAMANQQKVTL